MNEVVITEKLDRVGLIRLNRPKVYNALNDELMDALTDALSRFESDEQISCVVITGSPKAFAAGADISVMKDWHYIDVYNTNFITRNWERLKTFRKPVIAAVSGLAIGGGCELAMMCDMVFAAENAKFALPEIKLGVIPGAGGTQRLPRAIGKAKAMDMCFTGKTMDASEAERSGLVSRIFPDEQLIDATLKIAKDISKLSLPVLMTLKESLNRAYESSLNDGLLFERKALYSTFALKDKNEGMDAFLNKREPVFSNQ